MRARWIWIPFVVTSTACAAESSLVEDGSGGAAGIATGGASAALGTGASFVGQGDSNSGLGAGGGVTPGSGGAGARGGTSTGGAAWGGVSSSGGAAGAGDASGAGGVSIGGTAGDGGTSSGGASTTGGAGGMQTGLPNGVGYLFPPPNGVDICVDAPLRIRFASGSPTIGGSGKVSVHDTSGAVVASVDLAVATTIEAIGGTNFTVPRRAFVDDSDAVVYLAAGSLSYGTTYYVTVDGGAISAPGATGFFVTDPSTWRFSTKTGAPPAGATSYGVALDGSGDFCTVQGALDAVPSGNTAPRTITIAPGVYHEIVNARGKNELTLHGTDRKATVIAGTNNNDLNPSTATRALVGFTQTTGLVVENLTIHNLTPQGGSQAEALRIQSCDRCVVRDSDILSLQDTLLWSGRVYAKNCYVEGNVDYVWGTGVAYFDSCEFRTVGRSGVIVQSRNAPGASGYVFVDTKLTADSAAKSNLLARIDATAYPGSHVAFIDCQMENIAPAGWSITGRSGSSLRFWEYGSRDAAGSLVNVGQRIAGSTQISAAQAATMRDVTALLGGWTPPP